MYVCVYVCSDLLDLSPKGHIQFSQVFGRRRSENFIPLTCPAVLFCSRFQPLPPLPLGNPRRPSNPESPSFRLTPCYREKNSSCPNCCVAAASSSSLTVSVTNRFLGSISHIEIAVVLLLRVFTIFARQVIIKKRA